MKTTGLRSSRALLLAAFALTACEADRPTGVTAPVFAAAAAVDAPQRVPNGVPYRSADYALATGRDGGASLSVRALLNRDGSADLEVTTGAFDGSTPPHALTRLQVRHIDAQGNTYQTDNHNGLEGGSATIALGTKARHSTLQIQGNVTVPNASGKGSRTGVVTVSERVNLRPDLAATGISGPAQAPPGTVLFLGDIRELNGDLAATADCIFTVDGVESARSDGLWVAEGDMVNCALSHEFTEPGIYTVSMAVENVSPGDYDTSNNTASMQIEIRAVEVTALPLRGTLLAAEVLQRRFLDYQDCDAVPGGQDCRTFYELLDARNAGASFYGESSEWIEWPIDLRVRQLSGGVVLEDVVVTDWGVEGCNPLITANNLILVCGTVVNTFLAVLRNTGVVVYEARNTHNGVETHSYFYTEQYGDGSTTLPGDDFRIDVRIDAQNISLSADETVDLVPQESRIDFDCFGNPGTCYDLSFARIGFLLYGGFGT